VKCHPAAFHNDRANRSPSGREVRACAGFLARELLVLRPRVIVTFGNRAAASVAQALASRDHGGATAWGRCPELVAFPHPSPRNIVTIRSRYRTFPAFEAHLTCTFARLIARLDRRSVCA
ncbi:MAG: uracil-DNA glycosylase family protein, partial [Nitrospirales bacterium]